MISVVACTKRPGFVMNIIENLLRQTSIKKELVLILNTNKVDQSNIHSLLQAQHIDYQLYQLADDVTLGECLNFGVKQATYDIIAKFDDDDYYSTEYLAESVGTLKEKEADLVGKAAFFIYFKAYQELRLYHGNWCNCWIVQEEVKQQTTNFLSGGTFVFHKQVMKKIRFPELNQGEDFIFQKRCLENGLKLYASSPFNYAYIRYDASDHHSSDFPDYLLRKRSKKIATTSDFRDYILA